MQSKNVSKYWGKPSHQPRHPYVEFENTPLWRAVKKALRDMEDNQDLAINEWHQYVVGYVCRQLAVRGVVTPQAVQKTLRRRTSPN
jgi:hypothetical protein